MEPIVYTRIQINTTQSNKILNFFTFSASIIFLKYAVISLYNGD